MPNMKIISRKTKISFCKNIEKQMVPCKSTAIKDFSFEWSHHRISSTDPKVRTTLFVSTIDSESERVNDSKLLPINKENFHPDPALEMLGHLCKQTKLLDSVAELYNSYCFICWNK